MNIITTGAVCLSEVLKGKFSLKELHLSRNNIGDDGIKAIAGTLAVSHISELRVLNCGISPAGARSLAAGLLHNNSVITLDVSFNNFGDDGIIAIARVLSNSQISELEVKGCCITLTGARSLAAGLFKSNIRILKVFDNPITLEGACLILQSAVANDICQEVLLYDDYPGIKNEDYEDYRDEDEVKRLMMILEQR